MSPPPEGSAGIFRRLDLLLRGGLAPAQREQGEVAPRARRGWRVLVVDDHPANRGVALAQLAFLGCTAAAVEDGETALEALAHEPPYDAVLLDIAMPGLDGYETCRRWRAHEADGRRAVVVAVTARTEPGERERCLAAGMDDVLFKPVQSRELAAVLDRWLHGRASRDPAPRVLSVPAAGGPEERPAADRREESSQADGGDGLPAAAEVEMRLRALDRLGAATGEELRRQVIEDFLRRGAEDLAALRSAFSRRDGAALAAAAHSLAGASAVLGARALAADCAALESAAPRLAGPDAAADCASRLEAAERGYRALAALLADHTR